MFLKNKIKYSAISCIRAALILALLLEIGSAQMDRANSRRGNNNRAMVNMNANGWNAGGGNEYTPLHHQQQQMFRQHDNMLAIRRSKANEVLQYMNTEVNPCEDFYDFACGKWAEHHAPENDWDERTPQRDAELRVTKEIGELLNEQPANGMRQQNTEAMLKVKDFYRTCMNAQPATSEYLKSFVKRYGGLMVLPETHFRANNYNWTDIVANMRARLNLEILVGFEIKRNAKTRTGNSIYFGEPKNTIIPAELCNEAATQEMDIKDEAYEAIQSEIADNMRKWFSIRKSEADHFAGVIVSFEFNLCKKMRIESGSAAATEASERPNAGESNEIDENGLHLRKTRRRYKRFKNRRPSHQRGRARLFGKQQSGDYTIMTTDELTKHFNNHINFELYMASVESSFNEQVYFKDEAYFENLANLVKHASSRITLANYIMYHALFAINFPKDEAEHRQRICVQTVQRYFPKIIGERYNRKYGYPTELLLPEVEQMFDEIKKALGDSFKVEWLAMIRKVMQSELDQWRLRAPIYENLDLSDLNFRRDQSYWQKLEIAMEFSAKEYLGRLSNANPDAHLDSIEVYSVDAKEQQDFKEVAFGWPLLRPPFYHEFYPKSIKYSFLGQRLAKELSLAFDDESWRPSEASVRPWDGFATQAFQKNAECFRAQYSNYLNNNPDDYRNSTKLREIVADSNGLNVAFKAYLAWLEQEDTTGAVRNETLSGADFTNTQLFFINFAQSRCVAKPNDETPPAFLPLDRHTEARYYVNGPLANNEEFAREFGCPIGSEMNAADKCIIFADLPNETRYS